MATTHYIVSKEMLEELYFAGETQDEGLTNNTWEACRSRPVPEWATHLVEGEILTPYPDPLGPETLLAHRFEEIKK